MSATPLETFILPALAGGGFSLVAIAYRLGQPRNIIPLDMLGICGAIGAVLFAGLGMRIGSIADVPAQVWLWGLVGGLGQYVAIKMLGCALRIGPLSPLWCVLSLAFVPTLVYARVFLTEDLLPLQYLAIAASILCVLVASIRPAEDAAADEGAASTITAAAVRAARLRTGLIYLALLLAIFMINSLLPIGQRVLGELKAADGRGFNLLYGHWFLATVYAMLAVCALLDAVATGRTQASRRALLALGVLAGAGSMSGLGLLNLCSSSAIVYAVAGITQILIVAVISVIAFGERTSATWYAALALGVLAVALANWNQVVAGL